MTAAIVLTFIAVFLLVSTILMAVVTEKDTPAAILRRRLRRMALEKDNRAIPEELSSEILKETSPLDRCMSKIPVLCNLERHLDYAGMKIKMTFFVYQIAAGTLLAFSLVYLAGFKFMPFRVTLVLALAAALLVPLSAAVFISFKKKKRLTTFTEQMPDVLMMICRSLLAGHSMTSAVELVGAEMPNPAGELFKTAYDQQKLGLRLIDTLANMTNRIESLDLRFFITAVTIHGEVGGNLSGILEKLADTIRERIKIRRQIRVYTAQGRLSGYVLAVMPVVAFFMLNIMLPGYEKHLFTEKLGNIMLVTAVVLQLIGFFVIRKIIDIRI